MMDTEPLNAYIRSSSFLSPGDSVHRAVVMLRDSSFDTLPVLDSYGRLIGVVAARDLAPLLARAGSPECLYGPVAEWIREPAAVADAAWSVEEARKALAEGGESAIAVLDKSQRFVGMLTITDLLVPDSTPPRPSPIGGMATPWGVYLTSGAIQAGVSNAALFGSGALLGLLLTLSYIGVETAAYGVQKTTGLPFLSLWNAPPPTQITFDNLGWFALQGLSLPAFLLLMRSVPLAGYHAAEHQVVHAMERNEPLAPQVVARMPRVHPRCGTNLMAGVLIFGLMLKLLSGLGLGLGTTDCAMLAAVTALFTWRSVGAVLQYHFTTRAANAEQIASGIAAAEDLERKYLTTVLRRPTILRRMWCMGLPQMVVGSSASSLALAYVWSFVEPYLK